MRKDFTGDDAPRRQRAVGFRHADHAVAGSAPMRRARSITARLALVFLLLLLVVILLGAFCFGSLSYFNGVTAQMRDRWLPSTGALCDLNNLTSDYRAIEASSLLAVNAQQLADSDAQMAQLERGVSAAEASYQLVPQDPAKRMLYARFAADWNTYRQSAGRVRELLRDGDRASAIELYNSGSKAAYDAASDTLDQLTAAIIASARQASAREELTYLRGRWLILAIIGLTCLCVAIAMVHVRRSISAPILRLADRMRRLAANETGIDVGGTARQDEIGEMARAVVVFRSNAIELTSSQIGLERQASMLRERLEEEQRLMLLQRNFISMASHEFRTPITIIDGHAQRLISLKDKLDATMLVERARKIRHAVRRITHLIQNMIDSMRMIDGDVKLYFHPETIDLIPVLREVCQLHREIAPQAQILEATARPERIHVNADPNLLFQAVSNLLSNAIKYSPDGGLITVSVECVDDAVAIGVKDRGIGISQADCGRLFERYFRGGNAAGIVGTGIGLYFVRTVLELHGGTIQVESREGEGSRFSMRLPLSINPAAARPVDSRCPAPSGYASGGSDPVPASYAGS
jgi:two-component system OmpR family sensor kinase